MVSHLQSTHLSTNCMQCALAHALGGLGEEGGGALGGTAFRVPERAQGGQLMARSSQLTSLMLSQPLNAAWEAWAAIGLRRERHELPGKRREGMMLVRDHGQTGWEVEAYVLQNCLVIGRGRGRLNAVLTCPYTSSGAQPKPWGVHVALTPSASPRVVASGRHTARGAAWRQRPRKVE